MRKRIIYCAPGQSIYDVALEAYGSIEGVVMILADNTALLGAAQDLSGQKVKLRDEYTNKQNVDFIFSKRKPTSI